MRLRRRIRCLRCRFRCRPYGAQLLPCIWSDVPTSGTVCVDALSNSTRRNGTTLFIFHSVSHSPWSRTAVWCQNSLIRSCYFTSFSKLKRKNSKKNHKRKKLWTILVQRDSTNLAKILGSGEPQLARRKNKLSFELRRSNQQSIVLSSL